MKVAVIERNLAGNLPTYLAHFDVMLVSNPGLGVVNAILERLS